MFAATDLIRDLDLGDEYALGNYTDLTCPGSARFRNCAGRL